MGLYMHGGGIPARLPEVAHVHPSGNRVNKILSLMATVLEHVRDIVVHNLRAKKIIM